MDTVPARAVIPSPTVVIDGQAQPRPAPGDAIVAAALVHPDIAEALRILGRRPLDWVELYKLIEIIKKNIEPIELHKTGWVISPQLNRFTENANRQELVGPTARHARLKGSKGSLPLPLGEAQELIRGIVADWINSLS
ncbi:hypothetical protein ACIBCT_18755 [Streptosporangium sp. NPDC050855]|uniref:hypothetical protein n=1 Tax=Streptosporangium sp. NPDC050855 TaxID=3366194 RepID=UPI00378B09D5